MPKYPDCGSIKMEKDLCCTRCKAKVKRNYDNEPHCMRKTSRKRKFIDYGETSKTYQNPDDEELFNIADSVCITDGRKFHLFTKIKEYLKTRDSKGFYVTKDLWFEVYYFNFIQENEYVKTTHVMTFVQDPDYSSPDKIFYESSSRHSHEKLLADSRFQKLIERTGLEFSGCIGGYMLYLKFPGHDVKMTPIIETFACFNVNGECRQHLLDLDSMQLCEEYYGYDIYE